VKITGMEKLTLMDYPGHIACMIFTQGCNFKCVFCHNSDLIPYEYKESLNTTKIMSYIEYRKNILDGVVISGGEPLLQPGLKELIIEIKSKGLKVKLDTNGYNWMLLKELLDEVLIDYVAIDIKADANTYAKVIGFENYDFNNIKKSIDIITTSAIDYEFRTTITKELHNLTTLMNICENIGDEAKYFLQNFTDSEKVIGRNITAFTNDELRDLEQNLKMNYPKIKVRGL